MYSITFAIFIFVLIGKYAAKVVGLLQTNTGQNMQTTPVN
jgi:hypothetical protein